MDNNNKYGRLEEKIPPLYSVPAHASGYVIPGQPGAAPPVIVQPRVISNQSPVISEKEAPDHLVMAILVTMCCCLPLGIVAILKASECRTARKRGDRDNALLYGREAKKFSEIGLLCGIALIVIIGVIYGVAILVMSAAEGNP